MSAAPDGVRVAVRLQPGARRNGVDGLVATAEGGVALKARVTAPPEGGKANAALIALLAKAWRLPKGTLRIDRGQSDRNKLLHVEGEPKVLAVRIESWLRELAAHEQA